MPVPENSTPERKAGKVIRVLDEFGFIRCEEIPDQDVYYRPSWFRGSSPLKVNDEVTFQLKMIGGKAQAHYVVRPSDGLLPAGAAPRAQGTRMPVSSQLFDWAFVGSVPDMLRDLAKLSRKGEDWEFKDSPADPQHPFPILWSYLRHTFGRLVLEGKVVVNDSPSWAAFNTGLVDSRYESIYALFGPNNREPWRLRGFCIAGEGADGQNLVRFFSPLPAGAHYFDNLVDLIYDTRVGRPELDWRHIIIERIGRYPSAFLQDHWPSKFQKREVASLQDHEREAYYRELGNAIEADNPTYRRIMNRVKDAVDLSIKRCTWNFKTAVPSYYPPVRRLQLLLPLCLVSDDSVDLALAVEKTPSGRYLGHTVLPLDWAYQNARLICRPDSDWLAPGEVHQESVNDLDEEKPEG